ncbi:ABC transporter substrate-binding protein [Rhizobium sp. KVB221]|uniref:ABC transporter substrate-binding protein n=1 Tax=Rhizobium setariae TaxID=2801340 RepID=A0A937CNA7_9HYPH|nr:CmpA/NrtA family ABC transporter substrate-binding protein [Rhizobium setariae]MBL0373551.1 ABC transporter substrate-binding protein [Rhizobium setariae]
MTTRFDVTAGFVPLVDSAVLVVAREMGFAEDEAVALSLVREVSWATIRDRLAVRQFNAAHILAPMPIACNLGLTALSPRMITPMALGLGGNAVTVSQALWRRMSDHGATTNLDPATNGGALKALLAKGDGKRLRFAVVHPFSGHNYELRYWLAACGIDPDVDIELLILPPPDMPNALLLGAIDGYCVGEPWNTAGVLQGEGHIATTKAALWRSSPEKVLGVNADWAESEPEALTALLRALYRSAVWCSLAENREVLAELLSRQAYIGKPVEWIRPALTGNFQIGDGATHSVGEFFVTQAKAATFPWKSHALWLYSQMVRWGQVAHTPRNADVAMNTYRPDIYRTALKSLCVALPSANSKVEGFLTQETPVGSTGALTLGPDGFFDGTLFDPDKLDDYIAQQQR